jgi:hypothetical protein
VFQTTALSSFKGQLNDSAFSALSSFAVVVLGQTNAINLQGSRFPFSWCQWAESMQLAYLALNAVNIISLPDCWDRLPNLVSFAVKSIPQIGANGGQFPRSLSNSTAVYISFDGNNANGTLPRSFRRAPRLQYFSANNNFFTGNVVNVTQNSLLTTFDVSLNRLTGPDLTSGFDNLVYLLTLNLRQNNISSPLPNLLSSSALLVTLDFSYNLFYNSLPAWTSMPKLTTLGLNNNRLTYYNPNSVNNPYSKFGSSASATTIIPQIAALDLSNNLIQTPTATTSTLFYWLLSMCSSVLVTIDISNNLITGPLPIGGTINYNSACPALRTVIAANNYITLIPNDLFKATLVRSWDFSNNNISGVEVNGSPIKPAYGGLPASVPPPNTLVLFSVLNNPYYISSTGALPSWVVVSTASSSTVGSASYSCYPLVGSSSYLKLNAFFDPQFYNYSACFCATGTYGVPPNCPLIPDSVVTNNSNAIIPYNPPQVNYLYQSTSVDLTAFMLSEALSLRANLSGTANNSVAARVISDSDYGSKRYITGMNTYWTIDASHTNALVISILLFINLDVFVSLTNEINIFAGAADLTGPKVFTVRGDNDFAQGIDNFNQYISEGVGEHGRNFSSKFFPRTALFTQNVLSNQANLQFISRDVTRKHFLAEYYTSSACPSNYYTLLSAGVDECTHTQLCTVDDYSYTIVESQDSSLTRQIHYYKSSAAPCIASAAGAISLPADVSISVDFLPSSNSTASLFVGMAAALLVLVWLPLLYAFFTSFCYTSVSLPSSAISSTMTEMPKSYEENNNAGLKSLKSSNLNSKSLRSDSNGNNKPTANPNKRISVVNGNRRGSTYMGDQVTVWQQFSAIFSLDFDTVHSLSNWPVWRLCGNIILLLYSLGCALSLILVFVNIGQTNLTQCQVRIGLLTFSFVLMNAALFAANLTARKQQGGLLYSQVQWKSRMLYMILFILLSNIIIISILFWALDSSALYGVTQVDVPGFAVIQSSVCTSAQGNVSLQVILLILIAFNGIWALANVLISVYRWLGYWSADDVVSLASHAHGNRVQTVTDKRTANLKKNQRLYKLQSASVMYSSLAIVISYLVILLYSYTNNTGANGLSIVFIQNSFLLGGVFISFLGLYGPSSWAFIQLKLKRRARRNKQIRKVDQKYKKGQVADDNDDDEIYVGEGRQINTRLEMDDDSNSELPSNEQSVNRSSIGRSSITWNASSMDLTADAILDQWTRADHRLVYNLNTLQGVLSDEIATVQLIQHAKESLEEENILFLVEMRAFFQSLALDQAIAATGSAAPAGPIDKAAAEKMAVLNANNSHTEVNPNVPHQQDNNKTLESSKEGGLRSAAHSHKSSHNIQMFDIAVTSPKHYSSMNAAVHQGLNMLEMLTEARQIYDKYIKDGAKDQINISSKQRELVKRSLLKLIMETIKYCRGQVKHNPRLSQAFRGQYNNNNPINSNYSTPRPRGDSVNKEQKTGEEVVMMLNSPNTHQPLFVPTNADNDNASEHKSLTVPNATAATTASSTVLSNNSSSSVAAAARDPYALTRDHLAWLKADFPFECMFYDDFSGIPPNLNNKANAAASNNEATIQPITTAEQDQSKFLNNKVAYHIFLSSHPAPSVLRLTARNTFEQIVRELMVLLQTNSWNRFQASKHADRANQLITWCTKFDELTLIEKEATIKRLQQQYATSGGNIDNVTHNPNNINSLLNNSQHASPNLTPR